jgi:hypothetical protein
MRYLEKHSANGGYWFRRGIPKELRPFFADRGSFWRVNLNTKDADEAAVKLHEQAATVESAFQKARAQLAAAQAGAALPPAPVDVLRKLVNRWEERELHRRATLVMRGSFANGYAEFLEETRVTQVLGVADEPEGYGLWMTYREKEDARLRQWMRELLEEAGWALHPDHPAQQIFWTMLRDAWRRVLLKEDQWRRLEALEDLPSAAPTEAGPLNPPATTAATPIVRSLGLRLSQAFEDWKSPSRARGAKAPAARTIIEAKDAVRRFTELHGDLPVTDAIEFKLLADMFGETEAA